MKPRWDHRPDHRPDVHVVRGRSCCPAPGGRRSRHDDDGGPGGPRPRRRAGEDGQAPGSLGVESAGAAGGADRSSCKFRIQNPIDAFVAARLAKENLTPAPPTDKTTLVRRVSLDLIGLPPTPTEVDAFLADTSPEAYAKVVERLLQSPHYGERWARHWLDAARYADSDGFEKDKARFIWSYRDWVVNALNRDLPYDQFIIEQLAGDQLPDPTPDQLVATGFLRNSMLNEEGGADPEQFRMDALFDRMDCIGKSILGLTIQCAQCHNHKFDPILQEEYYRLFAFLNNDHESSRVAYTPAEEMLRADLLRQMRDLEEGLRHTTPGWEERMTAWEESVKNDQPEWIPVPSFNAGENGERFYYYPDNSIRAASYAPTTWTAHFRGTNSLPLIGAFRFEQFTDPNLPCGSHGPLYPRHGGAERIQGGGGGFAEPDEQARG